MKSKLLYFSSLVVILAAILVFACQKDNGTKDQTIPVVDTSEKNVVEVFNTIDELNVFGSSGFDSNSLKALDLTLGSCPSISVNLTQQPLSITLDWGTTGCKNNDGLTRSGKIIITLSGMMNVVGNVATFKFVDFVSDGKKISGVHRITFNGLNAGNNWPRYSDLSEIKIVYSDNTFITYRAETTRLQAAGVGTATQADDVWRMEGTSTGVNRDGSKWSAKVTKVLIKKGECKYIGSGTIQISPVSPSTGPVRTLDFGNEACDNKATLTVEGKTTEITL